MATREDWIGRTGLEWARRGPALEALLGPAGEAGLSALAARPGERILDLGCGAGASTAAIAAAVGPTGHVCGIDVSPDLGAAAHERLAGVPNAGIVIADAASHGFDTPFDALYSRFGSMFFDDPAAAFRNLHRAMRSGSRAVFVAWRAPARNQWASVPMTFVPEGLSEGAPQGQGPFAWADPAVYRPILAAGGFKAVTERSHEYMAEIGDGDDPDPVARAVAFTMRIGPMASRMRGLDDDARRDAEAFLARRLARHVSQGAVRLLASAWIIEAHA